MEENKRDQTWFGLAMILCGALVSIPSLILGGSLVSGIMKQNEKLISVTLRQMSAGISTTLRHLSHSIVI